MDSPRAGARARPRTTNAANGDSELMPVQASTDEQLIQMWLHGRSKSTIDAYTRDVKRFLLSIQFDIKSVTLGDLQNYQDSLKGASDKSIMRRMAAIRSLLSFGHKLGYIHFNPGGALRTPRAKNDLAERILSKGHTIFMVMNERDPRDLAIMSFIYCTGARVSEAARARWRDIREVDDTAIVTLYGKGDKTRFSRLTASTFQKLLKVRPEKWDPDTPLFPSTQGGRNACLSRIQMWRIVRRAARAAGIEADVSPHWLRHAHASHALDAGANIVELQQQLGHSSVATTGMYTHIKPEQSTSRFIDI